MLSVCEMQSINTNDKREYTSQHAKGSTKFHTLVYHQRYSSKQFSRTQHFNSAEKSRQVSPCAIIYIHTSLYSSVTYQDSKLMVTGRATPVKKSFQTSFCLYSNNHKCQKGQFVLGNQQFCILYWMSAPQWGTAD